VLNQPDESLALEWFADVVVHPGLLEQHDLLGPDVRRHGDDRDIPRRVRQSSDVLGGCEAIDIGHLDVHQHQIIGSRLNGAVVPPARARGLRSVSHPAMSFHAV
jgi:hypothetical protein